MTDRMLRTFYYKLYPNQEQVAKLTETMRVCCWIYNHALAQRIKAYKRRGERCHIFGQDKLLTQIRKRMPSIRAVNRQLEFDALRRVDLGMAAFFRRIKAGQKPGFPRFRPWRRYCSAECLRNQIYHHDNKIRIPSIGLIRCRGRSLPAGQQRALRIIRRSSGWYAQILLEDNAVAQSKQAPSLTVGIDVGLSSFATLSNGEAINNPRFGHRSRRKLTALQRRISRRVKWSRRRASAVRSLARQHERIADQRRNFCHQQSTALVRKYDLIAVEKLNVKGMARSRFAKSILDAAWTTFTNQLVVKAECAGRQVVFVNPRGTSQECPKCGAIKPKKLSERIHSCECGCVCQRDHASAQVILARAVAITAATRPWTELASDAAPVAKRQASRLKRVNLKKL